MNGHPEPDPREPDDRALLGRLRRMWEELDPPPPGFTDRLLFALELEDLDAEWLTLQTDLELSAARAVEPEDARTITFSSDSLTIMVSLSRAEPGDHRLDGWVVPPGPFRVELRFRNGSRSTTVDEDGRFAFDDLPSGPVQLVMHPDGDGPPPAQARTVVTPAFVL